MAKDGVEVVAVARKRRIRFALTLTPMALLIGVVAVIFHAWAVRESMDRALIGAVRRGDAFAVKTLLDQGADPCAREDSGHSLSFWQGLVDLLNRLRSRNTGRMEASRRTVLALALEAEQPNPEIIRVLLYRGAPVNTMNHMGMTALMWAAQAGHTDIAGFLLSRGADVNIQDHDGETALAFAMESDNIDATLAKALIERGANVNCMYGEGFTPLMSAALFYDTGLMKLLLDRGADVNTKGYEGRTALMMAARVGRKSDLVKVLLARGANINLQDHSGKTALMEAAQYGRIETVKLLLDHGANVNVKKCKER